MDRVRVTAAAFAVLAATQAFAGSRSNELLSNSEIVTDPTFYAVATTAPAMPAVADNILPSLRRCIVELRSAAARTPPAFRFPELEKEKLAAFQKERDSAMQAAIDKMAGTVGRISFRIKSIAVRPKMMSLTVNLRPTADWASRKSLSNAALAREAATASEKPLVAIGEIMLTDSERLKSARAEQQKLSTSSASKTKAANAANVRKKLDAATGSDDYVYIYGSPDEFKSWQVGQRRSVVGVVSRVRVALLPRKDDGAIQFDAIVTPLAKAEVVAGDAAGEP